MKVEKQESLYKRFLKSKPEFSSNKEALSAYTHELETLAKSVNKEVYELLDEAEGAIEWTEVHRKAKNLAMLIGSLKQIQN